MRCFVIFLLLGCSPLAIGANLPGCHTVLWPARQTISPQVITNLQAAAASFINAPPNPMKHLASAGKIELTDKDLQASRRAILDTDRAAILALLYDATHEARYLEKTRAILTAWATKYQPSGHPIDETRLAGLLWAYDLVACDLTPQEQRVILAWFNKLRAKKLAWAYSTITANNNHHVHQLKLLLLLDKVLQDERAFRHHTAEAGRLAMKNLALHNGASIDYVQRDALFYHNYVLQAWLEIALLIGHSWPSLERAYAFLLQRVQQGEVQHEFEHSTAKIDQERANNGFIYAQRDGTFDVAQAAPTIVRYYTLMPMIPPSGQWNFVLRAKTTPQLVFLLARRASWTH